MLWIHGFVDSQSLECVLTVDCPELVGSATWSDILSDRDARSVIALAALLSHYPASYPTPSAILLDDRFRRPRTARVRSRADAN